MKKNKYKDQFNKETILSSDDSEDDDPILLRQKLNNDQQVKDDEEDKRLQKQIAEMDLISVVEQNEKKSEEQARAKHQNSFSVFQYDKNYYSIHTIEKKLMDHQRLTKIAEYVYNTSVHQFQGLPYCIKHYKNIIFVGISQSLIRVFDSVTDEELKPLTINKGNKDRMNKVICMDVSLTGEHLVAGYAEGNIALFDIKKQKLIIEITDVFHNSIESIKFLSIDSPLSIVSGDWKGILYKIVITRNFLMYSYKTELVMKKQFTDFCSLAALQPFRGMPYEVSEWHIHNIVAFANTEEVNVAVLGADARKLYTISRSEFSKNFVEPGSLCYLDWGYGITPLVSREKSRCLLAIAWGKVLQIMILENPDKGTSGIKGDGYYISDYPIDSVYFISDSILMILVNQKEVRILYIPHFLPGSYWYEGHKNKTSVDGQAVKPTKKFINKHNPSQGEAHLREVSCKSELESGTTLLDGNLRWSITADKPNFNNMISLNENSLIVLGQEKVLSAKLFHWEDYLNYVQKQTDSLVKLKTALDIYHGEIKGYYGVPYIKEERERALRHKMMDLIQEGIREMIKNFNSNDRVKQPSNDFSADNIAIKAAVEFCNRTNALQFLFTGIYKIFAEEGLAEKFIENLEPFILSGYFKDEHLPDIILKKIWDHYFNNNKYHDFERVVSKLNFSHYSLFDQLETICKEKMLTTALIHLIITSTLTNPGKACTQILINVFNRFKQAKKLKSLDEVKEMILKDEESKFNIEASYEYIGVKLMYIIKLFINGDKFPSGKLQKGQQQLFLAQSVEFIMREDESLELLKLNSRTFFKVVAALFINDYVASQIIKMNKRLSDKGVPSIGYNHLQIIMTLHDRIMLIQTEKHIKFEYAYFIVQIANADCCKNDPQKVDELSNKVYNSIKNSMEAMIEFKEKNDKVPQEEYKQKYKYSGPDNIGPGKLQDDILKIMPVYAQKMEDSELEDLIYYANQLKYDLIKINLYEQRQDLDRCVDIYINSKEVKTKEVFTWLHKVFQKRDKLKENKFEDLRKKISLVIEELILTNSEETGYVIDNWLPDKQNEIIKKLDKKPDLQLKYLESYLKEREDTIKDTLTAVSININSSTEAKNFKQYLLKHVELLSKNNSPKLIEVVKKEYYPLEWLDNTKKTSSTLIKEAQGYLKKRAGMYTQAINIFLELLKQCDKDSIEWEIYTKNDNSDSKSYFLSFKNIFSEILDCLREHSKQANASKDIWFQCMKEMFKIRDSFISKKNQTIHNLIYQCISDLMQMMSEYADPQEIITELLKIDPDITYHYAKNWFKGLYVSKNDQELLYTSAKRLLSNENSALIDTIIEKNNVGFIGERDKQIWALCSLNLGGFVNDNAFILTQCDHKFHSKCFFEEIKNRRILEGKKESDTKPECPICKRNHIEFDEKKKKPSIGGRRRRNNKKKDEVEEENNDYSDDEMSMHPLMEKKQSITNMTQMQKEFKNMNDDLYMQRLKAFDEDFAASQFVFSID